MRYLIFLITITTSLITSCAKEDFSYSLVPKTVVNDSSLPSIELNIARHKRLIHYNTFGNPDNEVLFIIQGGLGSDFRRIIPLAERFSNDYFVVVWDPRGCGLSERITRKEVSFEFFIEELHALKKMFSPSRQISLIGESWGGVYSAMYADAHLEEVKNIAFIESGPIRDDIVVDVSDYASSSFWSEWVQVMLWNQEFISPKDHEEMDYKWLYAWKDAVGSFFCDPENAPEIPIWRYGAFMGAMGEELLGGDAKFDFTQNLQNFPDTLYFIGTECSPLGVPLQTQLADLFTNSEFILVGEPYGHYLTVENPDLVYEILFPRFN